MTAPRSPSPTSWTIPQCFSPVVEATVEEIAGSFHPFNQIPLLAEGGADGEVVELFFELKVLADVGIIGMPNAGKSTLLSTCSAAKPRVANYPFTTLTPVLGMVEHGQEAFLLVEIPGLIEGAHEGVGLGHEFLRHVSRTRLLWHLVDGMSDNVVDRLDMVNRELGLFSHEA